ncbi:MAG: hypothetical protein OHK0046_25180 [Anaerolineae bacterium]
MAKTGPTHSARIPQYVDRNEVYPPPYTCAGVKMFGFIFQADQDKLIQFCNRTLNFNDKRHYRPITPYVMVTYTFMSQVRAAPPYDQRGWFTETEVAVWVPTFGMNHVLGSWVIDPFHPAFYTPYIFVDNPIAIAGGREIYGFPKQWGQTQMPHSHTEPQVFTTDVFALKTFSPDSQGGQMRLMDITRTYTPTEEPQPYQSLSHLFSDVLGRFGHTIESGVTLAEDLFRLQVPMVFLKEFRDIDSEVNACYQAITEASAQVTRFSGWHLPGTYQMTLEDLASVPLFDDLGLQSQTSHFNFWLDIDMTLGLGQRVWAESVTK